jgi:hypothetical protein
MRIWTGLRRNVARAHDHSVDAGDDRAAKRGGLANYHGKSSVIASCAIIFRAGKLNYLSRSVFCRQQGK